MATKPYSASSESPKMKPAPAATRTASRGMAKSNSDTTPRLPNSRLSVDRSPSSVTSKPTLDRRSPKPSTTPDNKISRLSRPSELQAELNSVQEELKKVKEKLALCESENEKTLDELKQVRKLAEEANEKLKEAVVAQKQAEENSEIEKFRAVEMEQAGIEKVQQKEEEWKKEIEAVRNQHGMDAAALLSTMHELQKVKEELTYTCEAKNLALAHAASATKLAETHAEEVESLSAKLVHLTRETDSRVEAEANENSKVVSGLKSEIDNLRQELEKAKTYEDKLAEKEACLEQLNVDLEAAKMAESYAHNLMEELNERVEEFASQADQAKKLERSASESLESVIKQLEGSNDLLQDAELEIAALKEKAGLLEISIRRHKVDHEASGHHLILAREETSRMVKIVESLTSDLELLKDEKTQALNNEQLAAASLQTLLEEKNKLMTELDISREEEEKSKKALESLASALHEVSSEARASKEKLLSLQAEHEDYEARLNDLNLVLKASSDKYEGQINDAKQKIDALKDSIKHSENECQKLKAELEQKELHLRESVQKSEEECSLMENEITRLVNLIKMTEEEACAMKEEEDRWKKSFKEAESEAISLKEALRKTNAENVELKMSLVERENELQNILLENEELQNREAASLKKSEELSKLLDEALAKKQGDKNIDLTDSEKDYDMLPKVVEFSEQNGKGDLKPMAEVQPREMEQPAEDKLLAEVIEVSDNEPIQKGFYGDDMNEKSKEFAGRENDNGDLAETGLKMWESCKIDVQDYSIENETEQESFDDELDSKAESSDGLDQVNGLSMPETLDSSGHSPSKEQSIKKKKPLLRKFGNLLKKKSSTNQK